MTEQEELETQQLATLLGAEMAEIIQKSNDGNWSHMTLAFEVSRACLEYLRIGELEDADNETGAQPSLARTR